MCIFRTKKFELYPEQTRLHEDYYLENETEQEHHTRILAKRRARNAAHRERNAHGQVPVCELAERKAAEHKMPYQPKDLATIEWSPANNPTRFTAKILRAGADRPENLGTFRGEDGVHEAEAAIRWISPDPIFVLPGRFAENVACLNPRDDRMYFDRHGN
ncbi:MAG TPA: hypothetical protein VGL94_03660 [Ktedonobacteraceae bacterium]